MPVHGRIAAILYGYPAGADADREGMRPAQRRSSFHPLPALRRRRKPLGHTLLKHLIKVKGRTLSPVGEMFAETARAVSREMMAVRR
jgi:hypothetical protein